MNKNDIYGILPLLFILVIEYFNMLINEKVAVVIVLVSLIISFIAWSKIQKDITNLFVSIVIRIFRFISPQKG